MLAALTGVMLTATTFIFSNFDDQEMKVESLSTLIHAEKKLIHEDSKLLLWVTGFAILLGLGALWLGREIADLFVNKRNILPWSSAWDGSSLS